jgi:hypothetical protein
MTVQIGNHELECEVELINRIGNRVMIIARYKDNTVKANITLEPEELDEIEKWRIK